MIKKILTLGLTFFIVYQPQFRVISQKEMKILAIVCLIIIIFSIMLKGKIELTETKQLLKIGILVILVNVMDYLTNFYNNTNYQDNGLYKSFIMIIFIVYAVYILNSKENEKINLLFIILEKIIFFQAIIIILQFISTDFFNLTLKIQDESKSLLLLSEGRGYGLSAESSYFLSFIQGFGCIIFITNKYKKNNKKIIFKFIEYSSILISSILIGRTGWLLILWSIIMLMYLKIVRRKSENISKLIKFITVKLPVVILLFVMIISGSLYLYNTNSRFEKFVYRGIEPIVNIIKDGKLYTGSTDILIEMYKQKFEIKNVLIGDGYYRDPSNTNLYYGGKDIGYFRNVAFFGITGTILLYSLYIYILFMAIRKRYVSKLNKFIIFSFFAMLFIVQLKGDCLSSGIAFGISLLIYMFCIEKKNIDILN